MSGMKRPYLGAVLAERLVLADGSSGSALEALAPGAGPAALLPLERPGLIQSLHRAYLEAGSELIETASFGANLREMREMRAIAGSPSPEALCLAANEAAARLARDAADAFEAADGRPRWVAGSVGPGDAPPSLGASTWAELRESYLPQLRGLVSGGIDLAMIETVQDPLQAKAALDALDIACREAGRSVGVIVSATAEASGRLLSGASIEAFIAILAPWNPIALGLNCGGGPDELSGPLARLAAASPFPLSFMPNAGLPRLSGGAASWPLGPDEWARKAASLAFERGVGLLGGCCGTGPAHIDALKRRLEAESAARGAAGLASPPRPPYREALASLYEARPFDVPEPAPPRLPESAGPRGSDVRALASPAPASSRPPARRRFFVIGERANVAGSAAFARLIAAGDHDAASDLALEQEAFGADALDLHLSRPGRDEAADLESLVRRLAPRAQAALCLDCSDPAALERVLPLIGGRALINSASLEDPDRAVALMDLARRFGAALILLCVDQAGPARDLARKLDVARRLVALAESRGLARGELLVDPVTLTLAAAPESAAATIQAIAALRRELPGLRSVIGLSNIGYGLPRKARPAVAAAFLDEAVAAGLDAAIVDPRGLPEAGSVDPALARAVRTLARGGGDADAALAALLERVEALWPPELPGPASTAAPARGAAGPGTLAPPEPEEASEAGLEAAILRGDRRRAAEGAQTLAEGDRADRVAAVAAASMARVGQLWNEGRMHLPQVLRAAEAAREALALVPLDAGAARGTLVLATVSGDLHDIGKNITGAILACSAWRVVDLGTDADAARIAAAARAEGALAVGLSGLLARSVAEMAAVAAALRADGYAGLVLCGGAAASPEAVAAMVAPELPGRVHACADAFAALEILDRDMSGAEPEQAAEPAPAAAPASAFARTASPPGPAQASGSAKAKKVPRPIARRDKAAFVPASLGARLLADLSLGELEARLDRAALLGPRWGAGSGLPERAEAEAELASLLALLADLGLVRARAVSGFFACARSGDELSVQRPDGATLRLAFPREAGEGGRSVADFFAPHDALGLFAASIGPGLAERARAFRDSGELGRYWRLHHLGSALAEAAAVLVHERLAAELEAFGAPAGRRYSPGFPGCPGLEVQSSLIEFLDAGRAGISVSSGSELVPEHSVSAILVARADAFYLG